ncbi:MAG: ferrous iron transport protein B [Candidatus Sumerlaeaceae bacterium]
MTTDSAAPPAAAAQSIVSTAQKRLILCGHPNVGKSLIFNRLTGRYATVSNYPGTTVEISSGSSQSVPEYRVCDTPGAYSLLPISEEEKVSRKILLDAKGDLIVHIVDAKNLRRMLPMTLELLELGHRVIVVLNLMDEARGYNVRIDSIKLSELLGVPVVETVATTGEGIADLIQVVRDGACDPPLLAITYERRVMELASQAVNAGLLKTEEMNPTLLIASGATDSLPADDLGTLELSVRKSRQAHADHILVQCATFPRPTSNVVSSFFDRVTLNLWTAIPFALLVVYLGVYQFVGVFGAGTLVDWIETGLYETYLTPTITRWTEAIIPWVWLQDLFVHDYGVLTLGLRYAIALILPIVGTFFILFSVLEDTGYLPRLALLLDRVFKKIGLNGRAVIPIILGLGCGTMATMVTRILETKRERIIATLLLGVAVPCSAQLGVILGILAGQPGALIAWGLVMTGLFLGLGSIAARTLPGEIPSFYLEMPPLRLPRIGNVLTKTYSRMHWYFLEILPLFLFASVLIWLGTVTRTFDYVINFIKPLVRSMGLPDSSATAFLFGFFRRDYGEAGLFDLQRKGLLDTRQCFVSVLVISLLLPCIAQFFVMKKERGWKFAVGASGGIIITALIMGIVANWVILKTGIL